MSEIVTLPHHFTPRPYQIPLLKAWESDDIKRIFFVAHRRAGKDKTIFANLPAKMMERVGTYFYFLPTYTQAKKVIWTGADKDGFRFLDHFPPQIVKDKNETEMRIELTNGSILQMVGADNIDRIVGTNPVGVVFSEYALMKPDVWNLLSPILAENGGWAVFVTTPRGQNHAYSLMKAAQKNPKWHVEILPVSKTRAVPEEVLEEERMNMPDALYQQEWECAFTESDAAVFKNVKSRIYEGTYEPKANFFQLGVDLAKLNDWTVLTPIDLTTFKVLEPEAFNQIDYNLQKARIEATYLRLGKPRVILDATGVGQPILDDLLYKGINITPFTFTQQSRMELLLNLQILLEQNKIQIPNCPELIEQLESCYYEIMPSGKTRMQVPDGKHDDYLMSLALAVWELPYKPITAASINRVEQSSGYRPMYEEFGI